MQMRHKTPQTFSLWMVDTLCCSLGAVIMLWLWHAEEAKRTSAESDTKGSEVLRLSEVIKGLEHDKGTLTRTTGAQKQEIDALMKKLAEIVANRDGLAEELKALAQLNDTLKKDVTTKTETGKVQAQRIDDLLADLKKLKDSKEAVEKQLAKNLEDMKALDAQLEVLGKANAALKTQGTTSLKTIEEMRKAADELTTKLGNANKTIALLEETTKLLPTLKDELKDYKGKLDIEEAKRKLADSNLQKRLQEIANQAKEFETLLLARKALEKSMEGMSEELKKALAERQKAEQAGDLKAKDLKDLLSKKDRDLKDAIEAMERLRGSEAEKLKLVLDQRFAGLSLTGENVVFLVDTSGSMDLVDENTPSAEKWPVVRETLVRLMNSMLNLKKFQVVTFSEDIAFPLGRAGQWIDFDPKKSGDQVREALARIKPSGGTNLHKAFEATFKMRQDGLDTVYLLSDGLPSDGEGLTPEQDRATLKDLPLRAQLITRHLRKRLREEWNKPGPKQERVRINSVGFFYESPDVGAFLWALSREHDGSFVGMSKP